VSGVSAGLSFEVIDYVGMGNYVDLESKVDQRQKRAMGSERSSDEYHSSKGKG
jgi:hypothetical protein